MPLLLDEKRIRDSSLENVAPEIDVGLRNCSMVYCFAGLAACRAASGTAAAAATTRHKPITRERRFTNMGITLLMDRQIVVPGRDGGQGCTQLSKTEIPS